MAICLVPVTRESSEIGTAVLMIFLTVSPRSKSLAASALVRVAIKPVECSLSCNSVFGSVRVNDFIVPRFVV